MKITEKNEEVNMGTRETSKTPTPLLSWNHLEIEAYTKKSKKKQNKNKTRVAIQCKEQEITSEHWPQFPLVEKKKEKKENGKYCNFTNVRCSFIFGIFGGQWFYQH